MNMMINCLLLTFLLKLLQILSKRRRQLGGTAAAGGTVGGQMKDDNACFEDLEDGDVAMVHVNPTAGAADALAGVGAPASAPSSRDNNQLTI